LALKIENFAKKIHGRVKILGWFKRRHGTFSESKSVAVSKNVHVLSVSTAKDHFRKKIKKY
jgi:hypothetical protein